MELQSVIMTPLKKIVIWQRDFYGHPYDWPHKIMWVIYMHVRTGQILNLRNSVGIQSYIGWEFGFGSPYYRNSHQPACDEAPHTSPRSFIGWESDWRDKIMSIQTSTWILSGPAFQSGLHDGMSKCLWPLELYELVWPCMESPRLSVHHRGTRSLPTLVSCLWIGWDPYLPLFPSVGAFATVYESTVWKLGLPENRH